MASAHKKAKTDSDEQNRSLTDQTPADQTPTGQNDSSGEESDESYAENYPRVSKDNLYMIIALWMEDFVKKDPEGYNKVGAVLVLPNDVVLAADCSRDGVHAAARLLMKHSDKAEGCKMFMSRKPCSLCAKLLVQSKVERVLFLPFETEYQPSADKDSIKEQVDTLFTASAIAQTRFPLHVEKAVLGRAEKRTPTDEVENVKAEKDRLINKWTTSPAFNDTNIATKVRKDFDDVMEWIARVLVIQHSSSQPGGPRGLNYRFETVPKTSEARADVFNPVTDEKHAKAAKHFIEIARFLATRTDDPTTGVGAVIVSPEMQILGLGWNGFPIKAHYGEFGRGSDKDKKLDNDSESVVFLSESDKKYPYVIHAEQNALFMRNKKEIEGAILFVTRSPCDECAPLIAMESIKIAVVDEDVLLRGDKAKKFIQMVKDGKITCYQTEKQSTDAKGIPVKDKTIKNYKHFPEPCK